VLTAVLLVGCSSAADIAADGTPSTGSDSGASAGPDSDGPDSNGPDSDGDRPTGPAPTDDVPGEDGRDSDPPSGDLSLPDAATLELAQSEPVEDPYYPETSNPEIDVLHYFLDLSWDGEVLDGVVTVTFQSTKPTDRTRLGLGEALDVGSVRLDGAEIDFRQVDDGLEMTTGGLDVDTTHQLTIDYSGTPEPTPAPSMRGDMTEGLGWHLDEDGNVYTFQEPYGAFTWYPVNDHPSDEALYDARITTTGEDLALFNGDRVNTAKDSGSATTTWHVDEPMASYVVTIAIGPYTRHETTTSDGFAVSFWLLPRDEDLLPKLESDTEDALPWLVDTVGPYPFSTLGVVVVGGTSGMETQTLVTMSRGAVERTDAVLLHEYAHMWFGNSVSPIDWQALWLNEGWAMYLQQWFERDMGIEGFGSIDTWRTLDYMSRLVAGPPGDYNPEWFGDSNVYLGPALMLDRIRQRIGDPAFERIVKAWPAEHDNQNVDRAEFTRWINAETGTDLTALIDRWLDSTRTPR
jgi:aminopeptidase N